MEALALAAALVLTAQSHLLPPSNTECSDCDDLYQLKDRLDALAWKLQDVTSMQHKMKTLERRVQLRDENARTQEKRLKATEGELGAIKVELDRRQRGVASMVREVDGGAEPETTEHDARSVEWPRKEKNDRLAFEMQMKSPIEALAQRQKDSSRRLEDALGKIRELQEAVYALESDKAQLEMTLEDLKSRIEMPLNATEDGKLPPPRSGHSRVKLNDFLKDVEELKLFEAAANHSDLMSAVAEVSARVEALGQLAERNRRKLQGITDVVTSRQYPERLEELKDEVLANFTGVWLEVGTCRKLLEQDRPWEQHVSQEIGRMERDLKLEMEERFRVFRNESWKESDSEVNWQGEIENITNSLDKLKAQFAETEGTRKKASEFRANFLKQIEDVEMHGQVQQLTSATFNVQNDVVVVTENITPLTPYATLTPEPSEVTVSSDEEMSTRRHGAASNVRKLESAATVKSDGS